MLSTRFNRWTIAAVTVAALAVPGSLLAQTPEHTGDNSAQFPSKTRSEIADHVRQLSGRAPCQRRTRRQFGGGVLSLGAAHRSEEQRTARPRLHLLAGRWRYRRGRQARRPHPDDGQIQSRGAAGRRRARPEAEEIRHRADQHQPVDPRTDHRSGRDAAVGLGQLRRRRYQGGGRQYRQADRSGMVSDLQGSARRHDPRTREQGKGRRRAVRARLQARRFHAARGRRLWALAVAQQGCGGGDRRSTRRSTRSCRGIRWCRKALRETRAGKKLPPLVEFGAGRCGRGAVRHRRHADPPRRRGSGAGLSAALALSAAQPSAGAAVARRSL